MAKITAVKVKYEPWAFKMERAHEDDAGADLKTPTDVIVLGKGAVTIDTGTRIAIPKGWYGDVRPRSGLLFKHNLTTFGTVDSGYNGTIKVRIFNLSQTPYQFHAGDKIAQLVLTQCLTPTFEEVEELEETDRGAGGFGSTGK